MPVDPCADMPVRKRGRPPNSARSKTAEEQCERRRITNLIAARRHRQRREEARKQLEERVDELERLNAEKDLIIASLKKQLSSSGGSTAGSTTSKSAPRQTVRIRPKVLNVRLQDHSQREIQGTRDDIAMRRRDCLSASSTSVSSPDTTLATSSCTTSAHFVAPSQPTRYTLATTTTHLIAQPQPQMSQDQTVTMTQPTQFYQCTTGIPTHQASLFKEQYAPEQPYQTFIFPMNFPPLAIAPVEISPGTGKSFLQM